LKAEPSKLTLKVQPSKMSRKRYTWLCRGHRLNLGRRTYIMGILNVTPDSFSDGGRFFDKGRAVARGLQMVKEGADIIDVGGESTRPGSASVGAKTEFKRVVPVIERLARQTKAPLSIDTTKAEVAEAALDAGASIVNDISGLRFDTGMAKTAAKYKAGCVIMHIKGRPKTMQRAPRYKDVMLDIVRWLKEGVRIAQAAGLKKQNLMIDPGVGFGKTLKHNLQILKGISKLDVLRLPILVGASRKSFIGKVLNLPVEERLFGTAASCALAVAGGAHIVRVHDVAAMKQVVEIADAVMRH